MGKNIPEKHTFDVYFCKTRFASRSDLKESLTLALGLHESSDTPHLVSVFDNGRPILSLIKGGGVSIDDYDSRISL